MVNPHHLSHSSYVDTGGIPQCWLLTILYDFRMNSACFDSKLYQFSENFLKLAQIILSVGDYR